MASSPAASPLKSKGKKIKKAKKPALTAAEKAVKKLQRDHRSAIRSSFSKAGFHRVSGVSDKEFTYENQKTDIDDIFVYENVIILAEYTCSQPSNVGDHLKLKKHIYDKILVDPEAFIIFLAANFPGSANQLAVGITFNKPSFGYFTAPAMILNRSIGSTYLRQSIWIILPCVILRQYLMRCISLPDLS